MVLKMVPRPASLLHGNLLEIQHLWLHTRPNELKTLLVEREVGLSSMYFHKPSSWFWCILNLGTTVLEYWKLSILIRSLLIFEKTFSINSHVSNICFDIYQGHTTWGTWSTEMLKNSPKFTQLVSSRVGIWDLDPGNLFQSVCLQAPL